MIVASTTEERNRELVDAGVLDDLVSRVDALALDDDWFAVLHLRDLCQAAIERGKQLWPVAAFAEYRVALDAPGELAASVLDVGTGRFSFGPLAEVAAMNHTWDELAPYVPAGPIATYAAHERVVRGENLSFDRRVDPLVLDIPLSICEWEPAYPLAQYESHKAFFPCPLTPDLVETDLSERRPEKVDDPDACRALVELAGAWITESNGRAEAVAVQGDARDAIAALGLTSVRRAQIGAGHALALMAWTGASGGAHGRRRGMASGRFATWWALAAVAGLLDLWPVDPDELGEAAQGLVWWSWTIDEPESGWTFRLAVEDPAERLAWAVSAIDQSLE